MPHRQPVPRLWLMTDERIGEALWPALARLPRGAGVVFRHHGTPPAARRALYEKVRRITRRRHLVLILADTPRRAIGWRADGWHGHAPYCAPCHLLRTAPAHDRREMLRARRAGADAIFLSPVFPTRSHPGAAALGPVGFARARAGITGVIALGGMDVQRFRRLQPIGAAGWAAIDAWLPDQRA